MNTRPELGRKTPRPLDPANPLHWILQRVFTEVTPFDERVSGLMAPITGSEIVRNRHIIAMCDVLDDTKGVNLPAIVGWHSGLEGVAREQIATVMGHIVAAVELYDDEHGTQLTERFQGVYGPHAASIETAIVDHVVVAQAGCPTSYHENNA